MIEPAGESEEELPVCGPQEILYALPTPSARPAPLNLFRVPGGGVVSCSFDLKRLHRARRAGAPAAVR
jgi:hypothetical protein